MGLSPKKFIRWVPHKSAEMAHAKYKILQYCVGCAAAVVRWGGNIICRFVAYFLSNISARNYHNWLMYVEVIVPKLLPPLKKSSRPDPTWSRRFRRPWRVRTKLNWEYESVGLMRVCMRQHSFNNCEFLTTNSCRRLILVNKHVTGSTRIGLLGLLASQLVLSHSAICNGWQSPRTPPVLRWLKSVLQL